MYLFPSFTRYGAGTNDASCQQSHTRDKEPVWTETRVRGEGMQWGSRCSLVPACPPRQGPQRVALGEEGGSGAILTQGLQTGQTNLCGDGSDAADTAWGRESIMTLHAAS